MPRGGRRAGTPGKAYSNRSDLAGKVPPMAASGQTYGKRAEQMAAQRAIPVAAAPASQAPPPPAPPSAGGGGLAGLLGGGGGPAPLPGEVARLDAPSERPGEPVTAGAPMGAGPGPEVLGALSGIDEPEDEYEEIKAYLPLLEFMASQPDASAATRNFVRRVRGQRPVV